MLVVVIGCVQTSRQVKECAKVRLVYAERSPRNFASAIQQCEKAQPEILETTLGERIKRHLRQKQFHLLIDLIGLMSKQLGRCGFHHLIDQVTHDRVPSLGGSLRPEVISARGINAPPTQPLILRIVPPPAAK